MSMLTVSVENVSISDDDDEKSSSSIHDVGNVIANININAVIIYFIQFSL